jgi:hypothetical protein
MNLSEGIRVVTLLLGGLFTLILVLLGILCGLAALLALCNARSLFFARASSYLGILIAALGCLLPFRSVSVVGTVLALLWLPFLAYSKSISRARFWAAIPLAIVSLIFWLRTGSAADSPPVFRLSDCVMFAFLPFAFVLVQASQGSDQLIGDRKPGRSPQVPLQAALAGIADFLVTVFPPLAVPT